MQKMIVDGYNVLHADPELKRMIRQDLQKARRILVRRLTDYLEDRRVQVTLVFDGRGGLTDVDVEIPGKLQILYSAAGQTADELIVGMLERSDSPRRFIVVTSDMADIGRTARAMGAGLLSSQDFLSRIQPAATPPQEDTGGETPGDLDYWLKQFGQEDDT
jgi:predicted RNA-binding protein with PIN domain